MINALDELWYFSCHCNFIQAADYLFRKVHRNAVSAKHLAMV